MASLSWSKHHIVRVRRPAGFLRNDRRSPKNKIVRRKRFRSRSFPVSSVDRLETVRLHERKNVESRRCEHVVRRVRIRRAIELITLRRNRGTDHRPTLAREPFSASGRHVESFRSTARPRTRSPVSPRRGRRRTDFRHQYLTR